MGPGRQGHLVDTQASGTVRAARDSGRTLQAIGHGPETPRKAVCNRGPSDKVPSLLGPLVDHAGPLERAPVPRDSWSKPPALGARPESPGTASRPRGPSGPGPSPPDVWSTPLARGPGHDSPGTAGQRGTLDQKPRCPGELVDLVGPRVPARGARNRWATPRALGHRPVLPGPLVDPRGPRTKARIARDSGSIAGPSGTVRVARKTMSTRWP